MLTRVNGRLSAPVINSKALTNEPTESASIKTCAASLKLHIDSTRSNEASSTKTDLKFARESLPSSFTLQGNLDPALLESDPDTVKNATLELLNKMKGDSGHILNLGHGIRPQAKIECMHALVQTVRDFN